MKDRELFADDILVIDWPIEATHGHTVYVPM